MKIPSIRLPAARKLLLALALGLAGLGLPLSAKGADSTTDRHRTTRSASPSAFGYSATELAKDYTVWSKGKLRTNAITGDVAIHTNSFIQLSPGMNTWQGRWVPATPQLVATNGGVQARGANHTAFFPGNLKGDPIRVRLPDGGSPAGGQTLRLRPLGLAYSDPSGTNILIAEVTSAVPQIIGNEYVAYENALDDIAATIRYRYTAALVAQEVVIHTQIAPPQAFGLEPESDLIMITELVEGPSPAIQERSWRSGPRTVQDQTLAFEGMSMILGRAFSLGKSARSGVIPVTKRLESVGNRRLIVERVGFSDIAGELALLPFSAGSTNAPGATNASLNQLIRRFAQGTLPPFKAASVSQVSPTPLVRTAAALTSRSGFLLDWDLVEYSGGEISSGYTYLVDGPVHVTQMTFYPGAPPAVLKYNPYAGSSLYLDGPFTWSGGSGKVILTSGNDHTRGEPIDWCYGDPADGDYGPALAVSATDLPTVESLVAAGALEIHYASPTVIANLSTVTVSASDTTATKGAAPADPLTFTISRAGGDWGQALPVNFTLGGTASAGSDYNPINLSAVIPVNQPSVTVTIQPSTATRTVREATLTLTLNPSSPVSYYVGQPDLAIAYIDDPAAPLASAMAMPNEFGLVAWWRAEGNAFDSVGASHGTPLLNGLGYAAAKVGQGLNFDGLDDRFRVDDPSGSASLNFDGTTDFSIEAWVRPLSAYTAYGVQAIVDKRDTPYSDRAVGYTLYLVNGQLGFQFADGPMTPYQWSGFGPVGPDLRDGRFHHVAVTLDRDSACGGKLYVDGVEVLTFEATREPGDLSNTQPFWIGAHAQAGLNAHFKGLIDEVSLYNRALSATEIQSIRNAGARGKAYPPFIVTGPVSQTVNQGTSSVSFSVTAVGTAPLSYQWTCNGNAIPGATGSIYTKANVQAADAGTYGVVVANAAGNVTSAGATLTVRVPPQIASQPVAQSVTEGETATFSVVASGSVPLTYQWTRNGNDIAGATAASYTTEILEPSASGRVYAVRVANAAGTVSSSGATLTVAQCSTTSELLEVEAWKTSCEDKFYVAVTNKSGQALTGGHFDLFIYLDGVNRTYLKRLQPWRTTDVMPNGGGGRFTFCSPDQSILNFDCVVIHRGAGNCTASPKFRIVIRDSLARLFKNTTQVRNPAYECGDETATDYVAPQSRSACDRDAGVTCACDVQPLPASANGGLPQLDNFYRASDPPEYVTVGCPKSGFKNVYAIKQWHGTFGPKSPTYGAIAAMSGDGNCQTPSAPVNSPDTTKYLRKVATGTWSRVEIYHGEPGPSDSGEVTSSCEIGRYTGKPTYSASSSGNASEAWSAIKDITVADLPGIYCKKVTEYAAGLQVGGLPGLEAPGIVKPTYSSWGTTVSMRWHYEWNFSQPGDPDGTITRTGHYSGSVELDLVGGSYSYSSDSYSSSTSEFSDGTSIGGWSQVADSGRITVSPTQVSSTTKWSVVKCPNGVISQGTYEDSTATVTYSEPYTSAEVDADCNLLLEQWNLRDDIQYPWRNDGGTTRGPLVTRNERRASPPQLVLSPVQDTSLPPWPSQGEGAILGAPLPVYGSNGQVYSNERYFNFYHRNWRFEESERGHPQGFVESYGAPSPFANATQWLDDEQARILPGGPFWAYGSEGEGENHMKFRLKNPYITDTLGEYEAGGYGAFLIKCKWAETLTAPTPPGNDLVFKQWTFNFRDFMESYRYGSAAWYLNHANNGCPSLPAGTPVRFTPNIIAPGQPGAGYYIGLGSYWISQMTCELLPYDYECCQPAVYVQPNPPGTDCTSGLYVRMPPAVCDEEYGSLWMGRVDQSTSDASQCDNYVANRNNGVANPATCEPQIELGLIWHMGSRGGGSYETFVAPLGFSFGGTAPERLPVDLDIDSDNNNGTQPPEHSSQEDSIEENLAEPGKIIAVNNGDSDNDGIPGFADGFNGNPQGSDDHFVPITLQIPSDANIPDCRLRISYSPSNPKGVSSEGFPAVWKPAPGNLRIWTKDANELRNLASANDPSWPGDYVEPGMYADLTKLGFSSDIRMVTFFVEGIAPSPWPGASQIEVVLYAYGDPPRSVGKDVVHLTVLPVELDIDSDNNNGFDMPTGDEAERAVKYKQIKTLWEGERVRYPGKILTVNDGDVDSDGVPDFAENLDLFEDDGVHLQGEQWPECPKFVPMVLHLDNPGSYDSLRVRFAYPASDPASLGRASDGSGGYVYTPASGNLRVWTKDGIKKRKVASVAGGGDYVTPDVELEPADLGIDELTGTVTLYVEAVDVSADVADLEIKVMASLNSQPTYLLTDCVRATALNLSIMNVDENNNVTKARFIESSQATPVVAVNAISVSQVQPSVDAQYIVGTLNFAGSISSAVADITPVSAGKNITEALVYVNGSEDPVATIPVSFTKTEDETSFQHPFPYSGSFAGALANISLLEGVNVVRVVAKDPLDGMEGYAEFSFEVEGISTYAQAGGITASLQLTLAAPLSDAAVDTITATLTVPGTGTVEDETLTETAANSRVFANAGHTFQVAIGTGGGTLDVGHIDEVYATVTEGTLGVTEMAFPFMQETGDNTKTFQKDLYWSDEYVADYTGFLFGCSQISRVGGSEGGLFKPYVLQVQGPDLLLGYLQEVELDDGPRRVEQSPIDGKYYVKMKNSPTLVVQFYAKRIQTGEPNHEAILGAMKDYASYEYGFAQGFYASGKGMFEGTWKLLQWGVDTSVWYNPQTIKWRLSIGDTFETEKRYVRNTQETARKLAEIYSAIVQDDITILTALYNGTEVDANDLSPYNTALQYAAELIVEVGKDLALEYQNDPQKRGYYEGYATFEILSLILPETKAGTLGKLGKAEFLTSLRARPFFSTGKGAAAFARLDGFLSRLWTTKMCFVAGTKVHTDAGLKNIEDVVPGDRVLSRDEVAGEQCWKTVRDTVRTHPTKLYDVHYSQETTALLMAKRLNCEKLVEDKLTATGEHPFFVANRAQAGFVPASELVVGDELATADGGTAIVTQVTVRDVTPGQIFTTYNLEVVDFHTYFVGNRGVWVHNLAPNACERVFAIFDLLMTRNGNDVWLSFAAARAKLVRVADTVPALTDSLVLRLKLFNEARVRYFSGAGGGAAPPWWNLAVQNLTHMVPSSAKLRWNMERALGIGKPRWMAAHHIVEKADTYPAAVEARRILSQANIHLDEAANGVWLPRQKMISDYQAVGKGNWLDGIGPVHEGNAKQAYMDAVLTRLQAVEGQPASVIRDELQRIAKELVEGSFTW